jgi:hypothetical protein
MGHPAFDAGRGTISDATGEVETLGASFSLMDEFKDG